VERPLKQRMGKVKGALSVHKTPKGHPWELWEAVRVDFVTGKGSLRWCSQRHSISYHTVCGRAYREDWSRQRESWFREKKLRESIPMVAAALQPPEYHGDVPIPQPLSRDFFLHHANRHHANLEPIGEQIVENWKVIQDKEGGTTIEQRVAILRETRELISLQRQLLGIPNVAPIRRPAFGEQKPKRGFSGDVDLSQLKVAHAQSKEPVRGPEVGQSAREENGQEVKEGQVRPFTRQPRGPVDPGPSSPPWEL